MKITRATTALVPAGERLPAILPQEPRTHSAGLSLRVTYRCTRISTGEVLRTVTRDLQLFSGDPLAWAN